MLITVTDLFDGVTPETSPVTITVIEGTATSGGGGGVSDHGALTGLTDDDHTQYHNDARGDARYWQLTTDLATQAELDTHAADTTSVHGITDTTALETTTGSAAKVTAHEGAANPHPTYLTAAEGNAAYDALGAAAAAQAASQPLDSDLTAIAALTTTAFGRALLATADASALRTAAGLVLGTDVYSKAAVDSGFQPLDSDLTAIAALSTTAYGRALLAVSDLAALQAILGTTGTPSATTYLRGDGSWSTPSGGSTQPYFLGRATAVQSVPQATWTDVTFVQSAASGVSFSSPSLTLSSAGVYSVTAGVVFDTNSNGGRYLRFVLGGTHLPGRISLPATGSRAVETQLTRLLTVTAGQVLKAQVWQDSGGSLNLSTPDTEILSWLEVVRVTS
jgi:hypothetical protein